MKMGVLSVGHYLERFDQFCLEKWSRLDEWIVPAPDPERRIASKRPRATWPSRPRRTPSTGPTSIPPGLTNIAATISMAYRVAIQNIAGNGLLQHFADGLKNHAARCISSIMQRCLITLAHRLGPAAAPVSCSATGPGVFALGPVGSDHGILSDFMHAQDSLT